MAARRTRYNWTDEQTLRFIAERMEHDHLFTGFRGSALDGYQVVLRQIGLQGVVLNIQAKKKWENLKKIYRDLLNPRTGCGSQGRLTAATWPYFEAMHEALGRRDSITVVNTISSAVESDDSDRGVHRSSALDPPAPPSPYSPSGPSSVPPPPSTSDPSPPSAFGPSSSSTGPSTQQPGGGKRKAKHLDPPDLLREWMQQQERRQAELDRRQAEQERRQAEQERRQAEQERRQAEQERRQAEQERRQAEQERRQAEQERRQAEEERRQVEQERRRTQQERQLRETEAEDGRRFDRLLNILDKWAENK